MGSVARGESGAAVRYYSDGSLLRRGECPVCEAPLMLEGKEGWKCSNPDPGKGHSVGGGSFRISVEEMRKILGRKERP